MLKPTPNYATAEITPECPKITLKCPLGCPKKTKSIFFWNVLYPSGFHRLDEPPEKNSAL